MATVVPWKVMIVTFLTSHLLHAGRLESLKMKRGLEITRMGLSSSRRVLNVNACMSFRQYIATYPYVFLQTKWEHKLEKEL